MKVLYTSCFSFKLHNKANNVNLKVSNNFNVIYKLTLCLFSNKTNTHDVYYSKDKDYLKILEFNNEETEALYNNVFKNKNEKEINSIIRKKFLIATKKHHPDMNNDDTSKSNELMSLINTAYEVLRENETREFYLQLRKECIRKKSSDNKPTNNSHNNYNYRNNDNSKSSTKSDKHYSYKEQNSYSNYNEKTNNNGFYNKTSYEDFYYNHNKTSNKNNTTNEYNYRGYSSYYKESNSHYNTNPNYNDYFYNNADFYNNEGFKQYHDKVKETEIYVKKSQIYKSINKAFNKYYLFYLNKYQSSSKERGYKYKNNIDNQYNEVLDKLKFNYYRHSQVKHNLFENIVFKENDQYHFINKFKLLKQKGSFEYDSKIYEDEDFSKLYKNSKSYLYKDKLKNDNNRIGSIFKEEKYNFYNNYINEKIVKNNKQSKQDTQNIINSNISNETKNYRKSIKKSSTADSFKTGIFNNIYKTLKEKVIKAKETKKIKADDDSESIYDKVEPSIFLNKNDLLRISVSLLFIYYCFFGKLDKEFSHSSDIYFKYKKDN